MTQTIAEIDKTATEKVVATLSEFKGKQRIDIRIYYQDDNNESKPTKKGINLSLDDWQEFKDLIKKVDQAIGKRN